MIECNEKAELAAFEAWNEVGPTVTNRTDLGRMAFRAGAAYQREAGKQLELVANLEGQIEVLRMLLGGPAQDVVEAVIEGSKSEAQPSTAKKNAEGA